MLAIRGLGAIKDLQRFRSGLSTIEMNDSIWGASASQGILHYSIMLLHVSCFFLVDKEAKQHTRVNFDDRITELLEYSHDIGLVTGAT